MADERFADASFLTPEGDALRVWHPDYDRAVRDEPLLMPEVTKQASGAWLKSSIELGFIERASMLIEGTWRDPAVPLSTLAQARQVGYRTHAVLVAVPPEVSRVEMLACFYEPALNGDPARWTPPSAQDEAVANLEDTAVALAHSEDVDTFSVVTREAVFVVDQEPAGPHRAQIITEGLERARAAFWAPRSRSEWLDRVDIYYEAHQRLTFETPDAIAVWEQLLNHDVPTIERVHPHLRLPETGGSARRFDAAPERLRTRENLGRAVSNPEQAPRFEDSSHQHTDGPYLG